MNAPVLVGSRESFLQPGVICWEVSELEPGDPDSDAVRHRGGLIIELTEIGGDRHVVCLQRGSRDDRNRWRAGISIDRIPTARIHWCPPDNGPCTRCPTLDAGGTVARGLARRLYAQIAKSTQRRATPQDVDLFHLAGRCAELSKGL